MDFSNELSKNVVDSFIDKIVVYKSDEENHIDLKIFLKLMPSNIPWQNENERQILLGTNSITQTRGGNSRSLKEYDIIFNYELCYSI